MLNEFWYRCPYYSFYLRCRIIKISIQFNNRNNHRRVNMNDALWMSILMYDKCHKWSRNCLPFRITCVHPMCQWSSCCSIFNFLCYVLQIVVCLFFFWLLHGLSFFWLLHGLSFLWLLHGLSFFDLRLLVTSLVSANFHYMISNI